MKLVQKLDDTLGAALENRRVVHSFMRAVAEQVALAYTACNGGDHDVAEEVLEELLNDLVELRLLDSPAPQVPPKKETT